MEVASYVSHLPLGAVLRSHWKQILCMILVSFGLRVVLYQGYMAPHYAQGDTKEYLTLTCWWMSTGIPCVSPDGRPEFWRTPGYPWFLASVFRLAQWHNPSGSMDSAIRTVLWIQMVLCSLLPLLIFMLAFVLYPSISLALCAAWIATFHLGYLLTSMHIHTDCVALLFLIPFFTFLYAGVDLQCAYIYSSRACVVIGAALTLGVYTLIRPMGLLIAQISTFLMLISAWPWREKCTKIVLFWALLMLIIGGWYVRNYRYTGQWFYNPTFGKTVFVFCLPKLLMRMNNCEWEPCIDQAIRYAAAREQLAIQQLVAQGKSPNSFVREQLMGEISLPIIRENFHLFIYDWLVQSIKTTFDLYTPMLVDCVQGEERHDNVVETVIGKIAEALYSHPIPRWMRIIAWLEFCFMSAVWLGFFAGFTWFLAIPFIQRSIRQQQGYRDRMIWLWLKVGIMIGACLMMTGANGYARLRLPVDMLIIVLSLTFWWWVYDSVVSQRS